MVTKVSFYPRKQLSPRTNSKSPNDNEGFSLQLAKPEEEGKGICVCVRGRNTEHAILTTEADAEATKICT